MKLWKLAATVGVGIWASGSGVIQVQAADIIFDVDFDEKIVDDFDDYEQTFINTTNNLGNTIDINIQMQYYMTACPTATPTDMRLQNSYRLNGVAPTFSVPLVELPDLPCSTTSASYFNETTTTIPTEHLEYIINDDADFIRFAPILRFRSSVAMVGRDIIIENLNFLYTVNYEFNTTYLFNYFLSDTNYVSLGLSAGVFGTPVVENYFDYVSTTAGSDTYFLLNTSTTDYGTGRLKFAVDYEEEYFRGQSVGARHKSQIEGLNVIISATVDQFIQPLYSYYYLNVSNKRVPLADIPQFEFEEQDCGSFLAVNVGCFINNGLSYVVNDAPIISDIFTLLNTGMQLGGQAFSVLGNFTDNNLIGVLVLGGAGLTAVRWFLKQD
jgi:hypothetical protein